jgi:hypothetical protein
VINSKFIPRRHFLSSVVSALACTALPFKFAGAMHAPRRRNRLHAFAIPDYERNPFLRPVGPSYTSAEQFRPIPVERRGKGVA